MSTLDSLKNHPHGKHILSGNPTCPLGSAFSLYSVPLHPLVNITWLPHSCSTLALHSPPFGSPTLSSQNHPSQSPHSALLSSLPRIPTLTPRESHPSWSPHSCLRVLPRPLIPAWRGARHGGGGRGASRTQRAGRSARRIVCFAGERAAPRQATEQLRVRVLRPAGPRAGLSRPCRRRRPRPSRGALRARSRQSSAPRSPAGLGCAAVGGGAAAPLAPPRPRRPPRLPARRAPAAAAPRR